MKAAKKSDMKTQIRRFRVARKDICYLKFVIESYDHLAFLSTVDARQGVVEIRFPSGVADEVRALVKAMQMEILMEKWMH